MRSSHLYQFLGLVLILIVLPGCPDSSDSIGKEEIEKATKAQIAERCERKLENALDILQPQKLGILTDNVSAINQLNQWLDECGSSEEDNSSLTDQAKAGLAAYLTPDEVGELASMRFALRDGLHIRDCYLYKTMGEKIAEKTENELQRVVTLFYHITRLVELDTLPPANSSVPMTPQEVLLAGRGSAEDRAVIFAGILQQLRIDSVLLQPASASTDSKNKKAEKQVTKHSPPLMGVLLEGKVYLFDMQLGLPIPALGDVKSVLPQQPATLADVLSQDEILRQLDGAEKQPYPLKAEDLKTLKIKIIINSRFWSVANSRLHYSLEGDRSAIIYNSLLDDESGKGIISRIMQFANNRWKREDISVWKYPEQQYAQREKLGSAQEEQWQKRLGFLVAPVELSLKFQPTNPAGKNEILHVRGMTEESMMKKIRMTQILGDPDIAVRGYQQVRLKIRRYSENITDHIAVAREKRIPINTTLQAQMNTAMAKNQFALNAAIFWTVVCQIEQGEYQTATKIINRDLRGNRGGARFLLAFSYAKAGKLAAASQNLKNIQPQNPYWRASQFVQKRCRILNTKSKTKPSPSPEKELPQTKKKETKPKKEKPTEKPKETEKKTQPTDN